MPTKDEIATKISLLTGETIDPGRHSKEDLEKKLEEAEFQSRLPKDPPRDPQPIAQAELPAPDLEEGMKLARRKVNRGSARRISRALKNLTEALEHFRSEIDGQAWIADEDGNRVADHPILEETKAFQSRITAQVNAL